MLFASFSYILIFLPVVILVCVALRRLRLPLAAQGWILAASIYFYGRSRPFNLIYLFASILANWLFARWMERTPMPAKKRILVFGLALNIGYLCVFKYLAFFASMVPFLLPRGFVLPRLPFPLGLSFFTVTQIMYLIECYEGELAAGSFFDHATFVAFFPYVISGPLGNAKRMRHQFGHFGGVEGTFAQSFSRGLFHFSMGVFKKSVFADSFSRVAVYGLHSAVDPSAAEAWIFSLAFALQLYFDFSGYSDMAIGSAMMLGIDIPRNFDRPYTSKSIIEFWTRFHISLSQFITAYLYTPIVRALAEKPAMARNMLFTSALATFLAMGIAGLWHGSAWTFVIYGFLHGFYLATNQYWRKKKMPRLPGFLSWALTFACVLISLIFFAADSVPQATARVLALFNPAHPLLLNNLGEMSITGISVKIFGPPMLLGIFVAFFGPSSEQRARDFRPTVLNCVYSVVFMVTAFVFINSNIPTPFVYFRF